MNFTFFSSLAYKINKYIPLVAGYKEDSMKNIILNMETPPLKFVDEI